MKIQEAEAAVQKASKDRRDGIFTAGLDDVRLDKAFVSALVQLRELKKEQCNTEARCGTASIDSTPIVQDQ